MTGGIGANREYRDAQRALLALRRSQHQGEAVDAAEMHCYRRAVRQYERATSSAWYARVRRGDCTSRDIAAYLNLAHAARVRVERWAKRRMRSQDGAVRAAANAVVGHVVVAEWGEDAPPLSRHLLLEIEAVHTGRDLAPGAPVPRCGCEDCTGIPDTSAQKAQKLVRRDLRPTLDVDAARAAPILDVAAQLGIEHRRGWARCPFHEDSNPSFHLNARKNRAFCNPCSRSWDSVGLVMDYRNLTFPQAVKELTT
jgi:hypothetical protein